MCPQATLQLLACTWFLPMYILTQEHTKTFVFQRLISFFLVKNGGLKPEYHSHVEVLAHSPNPCTSTHYNTYGRKATRGNLPVFIFTVDSSIQDLA